MHSLTCMSVVVCVVRKPRPCNSYSRRRDRINSVLLRSYYKGRGGYISWNVFLAISRNSPFSPISPLFSHFSHYPQLRLRLAQMLVVHMFSAIS